MYRLRRKPYALPCVVLVPDFVTIFTTPPDARPYSAAKPFVMIWNSWTASCETVVRVPPEM